MKKPSILFSSFAMAVIALVALPSHAETATGATPPTVSTAASAAKLAPSDIAFLKKAAQNGHAEVEGSKLVKTKGNNTQVKSFAEQMITDHTKVGAELDALAASKGIKVPIEPSVFQKVKARLLRARDGTSFDRAYVDSLGVKAHEDTVRLFQKAVKEAKDADVKAFAEKTLPALQHHLEMARDLKHTADRAVSAS